MSGGKQNLRPQAAQIECNVIVNRTVWVYQTRLVKKDSLFPARATNWIGNRIVKLCNLCLKFIRRSRDPCMTPYLNPQLAEETVSADMIEMLFGVDNSQAVVRPSGGSVAVNGLGG